MKNGHQISMNYNRVISLTAELDRLSDELGKEISDKTNNNISLLLSGWEGDNSSEFMRKISDMQENSMETVSSIKKITDGIRSNAKMVYDAEMEAIRLINTKES